jgi:hypothetical protein
LSFVHYLGEAGGFCCENATSLRSESVIAPARVIVSTARTKLFHPMPLDQFLQIVIECAGPEFVLPLGLAADLLHDSVAVQILAGKGKQNVQGRRRQREKRLRIFCHSSDTVISESELLVKSAI